MDKEGPPLESLLHRITEIPEDFLPSTENSTRPALAVQAVVYDVAESLGVTLSAADLKSFATLDTKSNEAQRSLVLLLCWVVSDDWFRPVHPSAEVLVNLLRDISAELARYGAAAKYLKDPDRREEIGRLVLAHFGFRPAGESKAQAQDRLTSLSMVERQRVLRASRDAEERARAIRAALVKKAADEAADKWTRE